MPSHTLFNIKCLSCFCEAMDNMKNPCRFLSLLVICFFFGTIPSLATDTISANQTLSGDQTIISSCGVFELGFFKPGKSSNYYIGIWYKKVSQQTIVWVANRDRPISDKNSAKLVISNGNLALLSESQIPVWSTNLTSSTSKSVVAVLLDSGNLVLRDKPESSENLWQSFDNPTNTFLPGGKIKLNKKTKQPQHLTSWKNIEDPAMGLFSLELDPKGTNSYLILRNKSEEYWTSGPWNGQIFSLVPEMRLNFLYNFTFVSNENESYFTYFMYNSSIISHLVMDVSGQIQQLSWLESTKQWNLFWSQPRRQCEVYAFCGSFGRCNENSLPFCSCLTGFEPKSQTDWDLQDHSGGCVRKTKLQCENPTSPNREKDRFLEMPNLALPKHAQSIGVGNAGECESTCFNNCSCVAYAYDKDGCSIWHGDLISLQQLSQDESNGETLFLKIAASEFSDAKQKKQGIIGIVIGVVGGMGVLLAICLFVTMRRKKRLVGLGRSVVGSSTAFGHCGKIIGIVVGIVSGLWVLLVILLFVITRRKRRMVGKGKSVEGSLMAFGYRDLQNATKNFSEKLGGGDFGSVFRGTLPDSSVIAVKKLESISQGEKQFRSEVSNIGTVQHVNLVQLRGFCSEGNRKLLVYDYLPNGSLDAHLFQEKNSKKLEWKLRYQIALGIARGLTYLHEKCRDCITHCDIKPENILLDSDFCPKVADFGLTKLVGMEINRILTTMRGTRGYLAPEWISGVAITPKVDVYSYGMMLFELVSGRRNSEPSKDGQVRFFPTWAAKVVIQGGDVLDLLDPTLERNADI
ncbi:G-type lectin S-receptor-like serine/threonine-protein kinase At2g19130 [Neltuma alba]|uniref:G-type lectin S-receptor-like serine/threonine-protein kinase At2g19130 n=1 Tax=Neltuma alba TaxID=207710 RepID=UPI0010A34D47|nr:G-type lectin S-receptor-like serine/threonine-protein kinase At2g19130 [Prosopis alba]